LIIFAGLSPLNAKTTSVAGIVLDSETDETVANVVVTISDLNRTVTSNSDGIFIFENIEEGAHIFETFHIGYRETVVKHEVLPDSRESFVIYIIPKSIELDPVLVSDFKAHTHLESLEEISSVLKGKALQKELSLTLASTLRNETGLAVRSMGPAPARPVIRGLGADRVFISEDGSKTTDLSATSPDHAVTIDPFNLERIEVQRGPKILIKTPTTIGGVVNVVRYEIPETQHSHMFGTAGVYGETVNKGYLGSLVVEAPVSDFAIRGEISGREAQDVRSPAGMIDNSYSNNFNLAIGGSYFPEFGFIGASYRDFELNYGVPGGFVGAHPQGVDIEMSRRQVNAKSRFELQTKFIEHIHVSYSNSLYRHKEFEASGSIGSEFRIRSNQGYAHLHHKEFTTFKTGTMGFSFEHRDFEVGGFVFTSPSTSLNFSAFLYEVLESGKFNFEIGARYNYDSITPIEEKPDADIGHIRQRIFNTYSLSFSAVYEITKVVYAGANVSKSSRVPTIEELYSEGPHLAAYSYEVGNPDLKDEKGFGMELFIYHKFPNLYFNLNVFLNDLSYYIIPRNTGEINYQTLLPIYKTFGVPAQLYGIENKIDWNITKTIRLSSVFSYTHGQFTDTKSSLPQIPPFKGNVELQYFNSIYSFGANLDWAASQERVDVYEERTDGYLVLNLFGQYSINTSSLIHNLTVNIENILDTEYRNHLSRIKSVLPEPGRNFRLTYKLYFSL
jgi:iron complex outermembrane receptor protein